MKINSKKVRVSDLAYFGGEPIYSRPKSIGSLAKPDLRQFLSYSKVFIDQKQYSNNGPLVRKLEDRLAEFHETKYCVTFASAFWGLSLTIRELALHGRKEIVMPSLTYRRMGEIVASAGYIPRFCDVEIDTLAQTASTTKECLNDETALIIGAHPAINCCDVEGLGDLSKQYGIPLVFDSVESVYETYKGKKVGGFGDAEGFSLHSTKLINGFEGGYITTDNPELAEVLALKRGFGFKNETEVVGLGINAKLNEMHAAMALSSLDSLPDLVEKNKDRYKLYGKKLKEIDGIRLVPFDESEKTSYKSILIELLDSWPLNRANLLAILQAEGVLARPYYSPPLHCNETKFETRFANLSNSKNLSELFVLLPCGFQVQENDITTICSLLSMISKNIDEIKERLK